MTKSSFDEYFQKSLISKKQVGETHWLERCESEFGEEFVRDVKAVWNVFYIYLPLPLFWALFYQQGSRWTFQASKMNGYITEDITIEPENMQVHLLIWKYFSKLFQVANSVIMLLFIPLFNYIIYPVLAKINLLQTSLQRIGVGFFMAALSFGVSGILDLQLEVNLILKIFSKYILNHFHALAFKWFENILQSHEDGSISILWQLPQYLFMTMAEILFGISTMEFCYSQVEYKKKY